MVNIKIKLLRDAGLPEYAHHGDSGVDLLNASERLTLQKNSIKTVPTGISVEIPVGYEIQIRSRSGLSLKKGLIVLNSPGTIDSGYRGEIAVILINLGKEDVIIEKGDKIAQAVLTKVEKIEWENENELSESRRGSGGFGSTDK